MKNDFLSDLEGRKETLKKENVGMAGFEPAATRPPDVYSNRAELHPETFLFLLEAIINEKVANISFLVPLVSVYIYLATLHLCLFLDILFTTKNE